MVGGVLMLLFGLYWCCWMFRVVNVSDWLVWVVSWSVFLMGCVKVLYVFLMMSLMCVVSCILSFVCC